MNGSPLALEATLQPDGLTLRLDTKLALPPGRVRILVQPGGQPAGPTLLDVLDRIHGDQQRRGRRPATDEETAAQIAALRAEEEDYEERCRQIWSQTTSPPPGKDAP